MTVTKRVLECPYCFDIVEVESPDKLHTAYTSTEPIRGSYYADVVVKKHRCKNPDCRKKITTYWYAPLDYFNRI